MEGIIYQGNKLFPQRLKEKITLYYKGKIIWNDPCLAIVGSRDCSSEIKNKILKIIKDLPNNIVIVSGLARGIDSIAHLSAIETNKRTIAVLPCGIEKIYPKENIPLSNLILKNGGLLLSEYPGNFGPTKKSFVLRNRIITGLSSAVLIAEAKIKSGTMHTANFAQKQGKIIFAIPGSEGTDFLISKGAIDASNLPSSFKNDTN